MRRARCVVFLLLMVASVIVGASKSTGVAATGIWLPAGALNDNRSGHTASLLQNGEVLITGGGLASAERYDPSTNQWRRAAPMATARIRHTATTLPDGRVLVTGGATDGKFPPPGGTIFASTEIYDPATDGWTTAAPLSTPRAFHSATLLRDGRVLVVGGVTRLYKDGDFSNTDNTVEIYDPGKNSWSPAATLPRSFSAHTTLTLANGQVLVIGGWPNGDVLSFGNGVVRYDPATNTWTALPNLLAHRGPTAATLLPDGKVLVVGGYGALLPGQLAERYDPATNAWTMTGNLGNSFSPSTATLLPSGQVLATGGFDYNQKGTRGLAALYDPATNGWSALPDLRSFRYAQTATLLNDGRVLVAGGASGDPVAELYVDGSVSQQCFPETGKCLQGRFLAYWLTHGGLAVNGYPLTGEITEKLEDGNSYTVQYLERVRLEYHPEQADPQYQVLLGQFGRQIHPADPPAAQKSGAAYFGDTGHNLDGEFRDYWAANGGLAQFGFPLSEVFREKLEDGTEYDVQYFERARFEYHPENKPPYDVLLGQFGRRIMAERGIQP